MANTYVDYTATAAQQYFAFNFPYLEDEHVVVEIEGVDQTITTNYTIETSPTQRINLSNPTTALAGGELVRIKRRSAPNTNLVDFQNGSVLTESELDRAYLHNRYLAEEATEGADSGLKELEGSTNFNANNKQIKNLADGTLATDAVNKGYVDTQIALTDTNLAGFYKSTHTGNGTDNVFTLSFTPQTTDAKAYIVSIDGLVQVPDTDYTIGATAITFNTIPANSAEICVVATAAASVATVNEAQVTALGTSDIRSLATWTRDLNSPTATGSTTARSLADRFADAVFVEDYGAVGDGETDGATDDTDAIQAALNASKVVRFKPGKTYYVASSLVPKDNQLISAHGATITTLTTSVDIFKIETGQTAVGLTIEGGTWTTDISTNSTFFKADGDSGYSNSLSAFRFRDLVIENMLYGFYLSNARTGSIENVRVSANYGVYYTNRSAEVNISNSFLIHNAARGIPGSYGIKTEAGVDGYPEGLSVNNTLFYRFDKNLWIRDIYEFKSTANYYDGSEATDNYQINVDYNTFIIGLSFRGDWISSNGIKFENKTAPARLRALFTGCEFNNQKSGSCILIGNFNWNIGIDSARFDCPTNDGVGVVCSTQNEQIRLSNASFEGYVSMMQLAGSGCHNNMISNCTCDDDLTGSPTFVATGSSLSISNVAKQSMFVSQQGINGQWASTDPDPTIASFTSVPLGTGSYAVVLRGELGVNTTTDARIQMQIVADSNGEFDVADDTGISSQYVELPAGNNRLNETHYFTVLRGGAFDFNLEASAGTIDIDPSHGTFSIVRL